MKIILAFIVLWPLIGFLFNGLGRNIWSKKTIAFNATGYIVASFIFSCLVFNNILATGSLTVHYFDFINTANLFSFTPLKNFLLLLNFSFSLSPFKF